MVSDDVILEQVENVYDPAGNVILTITRQRYHNAPDNQTGPLQDPSTTPKARVTYVAFYHDPIGRIIATADYGTNGGVPLTRSPTIPASSDTVLVTRTRYDRAGNEDQTIDPSGMVTTYEHDAARRKTKVIENYQAASSSSSSSSSGGCEPSDDANRTTRFTYTPDGQQATLVAENPRTEDQTTTWSYGTTLDDSDIASSQLLRSVAYPDSTGGSDLVLYSYNRLGERTTLTDQRGCVHTYDRDKLGRIIHDRVTTLGSGVDGAIRRLSTSYDVRGLTNKLTSWNNASVNSGDVVNECQMAYNDFMQLIADYQNHSGAVNTGTTPKVQYGYEDGSANTIRLVTLTYPNGRVITYDYGTADGINDAISRIARLIDDDDTHLVDYSFLGLGIIVVVDYTEPDVKYTLVDLSGTNDPDTGDIYSGLDRFGRGKDCRWYDYGNTTDTVRLKYGYDRASNRLWRADLVAQSLSKEFDELYSYDGLHRLKDMQRGLLNGSNTAVTNPTFGQCWSLDPTSNWHGFKEAAAGGSWTLDQSRSANTVNEITGITNWTGPTWVTPAYDSAGNTTTIPQPADPTESYTGTYDAWNRLVKLTDDATDDTIQENQYDARNFRTVRKDYTEGDLAETRHFYYTFRWQSIEERLGTSPNSAAAECQFIWGRRYIDDLVLRGRDTDNNGSHDERLYGLQDANWNMVALIDISANAQERYLYSPFGWQIILDGNMSTVRTTSEFDNEILFTGQRLDWTSHIHLFRNRWFDSITGRFTTRDPLGSKTPANADMSFRQHISEGLNHNIYAYALSSPLSFTDPAGLAEQASLPFGGSYTDLLGIWRWWNTPPLVSVYIGRNCVQCCGIDRSAINNAADEAMEMGYKAARDQNIPPNTQHRALRHCVALGNLARLLGGCKCADCLGEYRELHQYHYGNQTIHDRDQGIANNREGLKCAGCIRTPARHPLTSPTPGWLNPSGMVTERDILACCLNKLIRNQLDTSGEGEMNTID